MHLIFFFCMYFCHVLAVSDTNAKFSIFNDDAPGKNHSCALAFFNSMNENDCILKFMNYSNGDCKEDLNLEHQTTGDDLIVEPKLFVRNFRDKPANTLVGVNMTVITSTDAQGYLFRNLVQSDGWCRYIDIANLPSSSKKSVKIWNDLYFFYNNESKLNAEIGVIEFPSRLKRVFHLSVPYIDKLKPKAQKISDWTPLLFVELMPPYMIISFHSAPEIFSVPRYIVTVKEYERIRWRNMFDRPYSGDYYRVRFDGLEEGQDYKVSVKADCSNCKESTYLFKTNPTVPESKLIYSLFIIPVLFFIIVLAAIFYLIRIQKNYKTKESIFILYSYDSHKHATLIETLRKILTRVGFSVIIDTQCRKIYDNNAWLANAAKEAKYVIIIWSDGAIMKVNNERELLEPGCLTSKNFCVGLNNISYFHENKLFISTVANVFWENKSNIHSIPSKFERFPKFVLPKDWHSLLSFLHGDPNFTCIKRLCGKLLLRDTFINLESFPNGIKLLEAHRNRETFQVSFVAGAMEPEINPVLNEIENERENADHVQQEALAANVLDSGFVDDRGDSVSSENAVGGHAIVDNVNRGNSVYDDGDNESMNESYNECLKLVLRQIEEDGRR